MELRLAQVPTPGTGRSLVGVPPDRTVRVIWLDDADPRYRRWLAANPDGFVLNTEVPPSARHLVLHRATCPRVSRPLPTARVSPPRFGKACATTAEALRAWAAEEIGALPRDCGLCGGGR
jgi:hypothetical protein